MQYQGHLFNCSGKEIGVFGWYQIIYMMTCFIQYIRGKLHLPASIYVLKVNNRNTRTRCEICSKLTIKTPERRQGHVIAG